MTSVCLPQGGHSLPPGVWACGTEQWTEDNFLLKCSGLGCHTTATRPVGICHQISLWGSFPWNPCCDQKRVCGRPCPGPGVKASPCVLCKVLCAVSAAVIIPPGPSGFTVSRSTHPCDVFLTISSSLLPAFLPPATERGSVIDSQDLEPEETLWCWGEVWGGGGGAHRGLYRASCRPGQVRTLGLGVSLVWVGLGCATQPAPFPQGGRAPCRCAPGQASAPGSPL